MVLCEPVGRTGSGADGVEFIDALGSFDVGGLERRH